MVMWMVAMSMGLVGSLHCLGMCSPLVMVITARQPFPMARLLYNVGRIFTYSVLGGVAGAFGSLFNFTDFQKIISVGLGLILIFIGITGASQFRFPLVTHAMHTFTLLVKNQFSHLLSNKNKTSMFILGALNGLLPCGLIYIAIAYCVALTPGQGIQFMMIFGLATLPVMFGVPSLLARYVQLLKVSFRKVTTVILILTGTMLLARSYFIHEHKPLPLTDQITVCQ